MTSSDHRKTEKLKDITFRHLSEFDETRSKIFSVSFLPTCDLELLWELKVKLETHFEAARSYLWKVNTEILTKNGEPSFLPKLDSSPV